MESLPVHSWRREITSVLALGRSNNPTNWRIITRRVSSVPLLRPVVLLERILPLRPRSESSPVPRKGVLLAVWVCTHGQCDGSTHLTTCTVLLLAQSLLAGGGGGSPAHTPDEGIHPCTGGCNHALLPANALLQASGRPSTIRLCRGSQGMLLTALQSSA